MADIPPGGWLGAVIAAIIMIGTASLSLRKYLSSDSVERAGNKAQLQVIQMLKEQLDYQRARAEAAEHTRDTAIAEIGKLRIQVTELTNQVQSLKTQLAAFAGTK